MHWSEIVLLIIVVLAIAATLLWRAAQRIDKLHRKVVAYRIALDGQLIRRAGATIDLAASQLLDPASALMLADAGYQVIDSLGAPVDPAAAINIAGLGMQRELDESALSANLRMVFADPETLNAVTMNPSGQHILSALASSWYRATLARRFHNQAVTHARNSRRHWWVRAFHLAGYAPLPETLELDDAMPPELLTLATAPRAQD